MYEDVEERVDNLETLLEQFILHTDQMVRRMEKDARRREAESLQWQAKQDAERQQREEERKKESQAWQAKQEAERQQREEERKKESQAWQARQEAERQKREEDRKKEFQAWEARQAAQQQKWEEDRIKQHQKWEEQFQAERKQREQERKEDRREWNKKWGEMANKLGTIPEDIVAPNIPRMAKELFGCGEIQDFMVRRYRQMPADSSRRREFDVIAVCENKVILNETKATVRQEYMENFAKFLPEIYEYFPEWRGKEIIPVFASLYLTPEQIRFLTKNRIYAMAMGDDSMEILNFAEISGKTASAAP